MRRNRSLRLHRDGRTASRPLAPNSSSTWCSYSRWPNSGGCFTRTSPSVAFSFWSCCSSQLVGVGRIYVLRRPVRHGRPGFPERHRRRNVRVHRVRNDGPRCSRGRNRGPRRGVSVPPTVDRGAVRTNVARDARPSGTLSSVDCRIHARCGGVDRLAVRPLADAVSA